jgi:hypothetical protein
LPFLDRFQQSAGFRLRKGGNIFSAFSLPPKRRKDGINMTFWNPFFLEPVSGNRGFSSCEAPPFSQNQPTAPPFL